MKRGIKYQVLQRIAANKQRVVDVQDREERERAAIRELVRSTKAPEEKEYER